MIVHDMASGRAVDRLDAILRVELQVPGNPRGRRERPRRASVVLLERVPVAGAFGHRRLSGLVDERVLPSRPRLHDPPGIVVVDQQEWLPVGADRLGQPAVRAVLVPPKVARQIVHVLQQAVRRVAVGNRTTVTVRHGDYSARSVPANLEYALAFVADGGQRTVRIREAYGLRILRLGAHNHHRRRSGPFLEHPLAALSVAQRGSVSIHCYDNPREFRDGRCGSVPLARIPKPV